MSPRAQTGTGLRPAEALPPTLTPNAVASMAQPVSKLASLAGTALAYAGLGACLLAVSQAPVRAKTPPRTERGEETIDVVLPPPGPPPAPRAALPAPPLSASRPPETVPPPSSDAVPETPATLPTVDRSGETLTAPTGTPTGNVGVPSAFTGVPSGLTVPPSTTQAPVQLELSQVTIRTQVQPPYPPLARIARVQGTVVLLLTVDAQGVPAEVQVVTPVHPSLDIASVAAARLWRFEPARLNGHPVPAQFRLSFTYRLK